MKNKLNVLSLNPSETAMQHEKKKRTIRFDVQKIEAPVYKLTERKITKIIKPWNELWNLIDLIV